MRNNISKSNRTLPGRNQKGCRCGTASTRSVRKGDRGAETAILFLHKLHLGHAATTAVCNNTHSSAHQKERTSLADLSYDRHDYYIEGSTTKDAGSAVHSFAGKASLCEHVFRRGTRAAGLLDWRSSACSWLSSFLYLSWYLYPPPSQGGDVFRSFS